MICVMGLVDGGSFRKSGMGRKDSDDYRPLSFGGAYMACRTGLLMPGSWTIQENRKNFHEFGTFFKAQNPSIALGGVSEFKTMEL